MITDAQLLFSSVQDIVSGTTISTNVYDTSPLATGNLGIDFGSGQPLYGFIHLNEAAAGATSVDFQVVSDSTADLATSPTIHWTSGVIAIASLTADRVFKFMLMPGSAGQTYERYIGFRYVVVGTLTANGMGVTAVIAPQVSVLNTYASSLSF